MDVTQVALYRREVLRRIVEYAWQDVLPEHVYDILQEVVREDTPRVRCCVHKERAVLKNRIQMALWQPLGRNIINAANDALAGHFDRTLPLMDVLPDACDACPIDKYYVTDLCRRCIQHNCMNHCPKHAITIVNNRAFINRSLCIECGRCAQSCPYGAILEISRPCIRACAVGALSAGEDKRTKIDYEKCTHCGNCRAACPFGAISITGKGEVSGRFQSFVGPLIQVFLTDFIGRNVLTPGLVDGHADRIDVINIIEKLQSAKGVAGKLGILISRNKTTDSIFVVAYSKCSICNNNTVCGSEALFHPTGEVHSLFNQNNRVGAGLLGIFQKLHNKAGVHGGTIFHFGVVPI